MTGSIGDHIPFECACHEPACMFCDGGLFACVLCGSFEGATTTECPVVQFTAAQQTAVYAGELDYRGGRWVAACSRFSPAFWRTVEARAELAACQGGCVVSTSTATRCDQCGKIEPNHRGESHPRDWYRIFGPTGQLDFCTRGCLVVFFHSTPVTPAGELQVDRG